jgi:hypothetical protein
MVMRNLEMGAKKEIKSKARGNDSPLFNSRPENKFIDEPNEMF